MKKEYLNLYDIEKLPLISDDSETSKIFRDGETVIKLYNPLFLIFEKGAEINTEKRILTAENYSDLPEINIPISGIYDEHSGNLIAARYQYIDGKSYNDFELDPADLSGFCNLHSRLENFLKRADKNNIILPDYCSLDNLIFDHENDFHFIDYEGMQIGEYRCLTISSSIMMPIVETKKYFNECDYSYTKELNILSHYMLFFLDAFRADLKSIGMVTPNGKITIDDFFNFIGLDDYDIQNKIWKLFQKDKKNEYLGDDLIRLQENYNLKIIGTCQGQHVKRLVRK